MSPASGDQSTLCRDGSTLHLPRGGHPAQLRLSPQGPPHEIGLSRHPSRSLGPRSLRPHDHRRHGWRKRRLWWRNQLLFLDPQGLGTGERQLPLEPDSADRESCFGLDVHHRARLRADVLQLWHGVTLPGCGLRRRPVHHRHLSLFVDLHAVALWRGRQWRWNWRWRWIRNAVCRGHELFVHHRRWPVDRHPMLRERQ
jgi:hypothetical protein